MSAQDIPVQSREGSVQLEADLDALRSAKVPGFDQKRAGARLASAIASGPSARVRRWSVRSALLLAAAPLLVGASVLALGGVFLAPARDATKTVSVASSVSAPTLPSTADAAPASPDPAHAVPLPAVDPARRASRPKEPVERPSRDDLVAREIAQMREIRTLLSSDPAKALALAEAGHVAFARGMLYQEREAHAILALVQLGQHDAARKRARRFLTSSPDGPFSARVRQAVGL